MLMWFALGAVVALMLPIVVLAIPFLLPTAVAAETLRVASKRSVPYKNRDDGGIAVTNAIKLMLFESDRQRLLEATSAEVHEYLEAIVLLRSEQWRGGRKRKKRNGTSESNTGSQSGESKRGRR